MSDAQGPACIGTREVPLATSGFADEDCGRDTEERTLFEAVAMRVVGILVPYALGKGEELARDLGQNVVDKVAGWLDRLRAGWADDDDARGALESFEEDPESNATQLEEILADRLESDDGDLRADTDTLIEEIGPTVIVRMEAGHVKIQRGAEVERLASGTFVSTQKVDEADEQIGPKFGSIG
jgi:hypothetical protein